MKERLQNCQEWLDNALALIEDIGDRKMKPREFVRHLAATEDMLRLVKCTISEIQNPVPLWEFKEMNYEERARENDRLAREAAYKQMLEEHFRREREKKGYIYTELSAGAPH